MRQTRKKRLQPSRQTRQGRKHKPRGRRGWVYLHPMFPIALTEYKGLMSIVITATPKEKGGRKFKAQIRRSVCNPQEYYKRTYFKIHAKLLRFWRESMRDEMPSPIGTMDSPKWLRLHPETERLTSS